MVLENPILTLTNWLQDRLPSFGLVVAAILFLSLITAFAICAQRSGPGQAFRMLVHSLSRGFKDLSDSSTRRIRAMARLAVKEAIRSYVIVIPAVFLFVLAFAGWFLDDRTENPIRLYVSFVLKLTGFLTVIMAIFLTAFSLPNDIKNKTIFTVVTKPVRAWEIILGRIFGFGTVGTAILALMGLVSYVWVIGSISHLHEVDEARRRWDAQERVVTGNTLQAQGHRHSFAVGSPGKGQTMAVKGHFHPVQIDGEGETARIAIGAAQGALQARVPIYGAVEFLDRQGVSKPVGINVGKEWAYRGYIEGATLCAGIFHFQNLESRDFQNGLPLEMTIRVFRTYKGEIERGIRGTLLLRNPAVSNPAAWAEASQNADVAKESEPITFFASDMSAESLLIDRKIEARMPDDSLREVDIFESLVHNGSLDVVIQCDERAQYFGMAMTDLYLRAADRYFLWNFVKTCFTIWLRMMVVISFGVMFSTFLAGPVAMLATVSVLVLGFFAQDITDLSLGKQQGGGPIEATIRTFRQDNMVTELDVDETSRYLIRLVDSISLLFMRSVASIMPNFGEFAERGGMETSRFVAYGFDIPGDLMTQHLLTALVYVLFCTCLGYFLLKSKEVAA
jgi:ABC-type transport system involved in multi-copper enzyme maturation permease subunit